MNNMTWKMNRIHRYFLESIGIDSVMTAITEYCTDNIGVLPSCEGHTFVAIPSELSEGQIQAILKYNDASRGFGSITVS